MHNLEKKLHEKSPFFTHFRTIRVIHEKKGGRKGHKKETTDIHNASHLCGMSVKANNNSFDMHSFSVHALNFHYLLLLLRLLLSVF